MKKTIRNKYTVETYNDPTDTWLVHCSMRSENNAYRLANAMSKSIFNGGARVRLGSVVLRQF